MLTDGLYGIYTVLDEQKAARRWTLPMDRLNPEIDRIVIWAARLSQDEMTELLDWVREGHTALIGGPMQPFGALLAADQGGEWGAPVAAHPASLGVERVNVGPARFVDGTEQYLVHLKDENGVPILVSWTVGQGELFWSADLEWLTNKRIGNGQNLELALNLLLPAAGKQTAFDEYHHGYQAATRWWQILRGPLQAFVILLGITIALLFWAYGSRFGSPRPAPAGPPRAAVEYVYSMSQLYRRAQARKVVLAAFYRSLTVELSRLLGGIRGLNHRQIAERTAHRARVKPEVIENLLNRTAPDQPAVPSDAELIRLARELEELQRRMQNAGYRDQHNPRTGTK